MGWMAQFNAGAFLPKDTAGDIWKPDPPHGMGILRQMLEEARIQILWAKAAEHRHGIGMEHGLDLAITTRHYN
eukprot:533403-Karenia_brevis.AAC.1